MHVHADTQKLPLGPYVACRFVLVQIIMQEPTSVMGSILGAPGSASPHRAQMLAFCGLPRMTRSVMSALAMRCAAVLIRLSFSSQNSSCRYVSGPACRVMHPLLCWGLAPQTT